MTSKEPDPIRARIESKGIRHDDIKHKDRLTDDEIASIPVENVFAWVKTGQWKMKDFKRWLTVLCVLDQ